jgi:hypothetical protein
MSPFPVPCHYIWVLFYLAKRILPIFKQDVSRSMRYAYLSMSENEFTEKFLKIWREFPSYLTGRVGLRSR